MKFKNLETNKIIEVDKKDIEVIERFKGYPDKFQIIEEKNKENKFVDEISEKSNNEEEIEETKENKNFKSKK